MSPFRIEENGQSGFHSYDQSAVSIRADELAEVAEQLNSGTNIDGQGMIIRAPLRNQEVPIDQIGFDEPF